MTPYGDDVGVGWASGASCDTCPMRWATVASVHTGALHPADRRRLAPHAASCVSRRPMSPQNAASAPTPTTACSSSPHRTTWVVCTSVRPFLAKRADVTGFPASPWPEGTKTKNPGHSSPRVPAVFTVFTVFPGDIMQFITGGAPDRRHRRPPPAGTRGVGAIPTVSRPNQTE